MSFYECRKQVGPVNPDFEEMDLKPRRNPDLCAKIVAGNAANWESYFKNMAILKQLKYEMDNAKFIEAEAQRDWNEECAYVRNYHHIADRVAKEEQDALKRARAAYDPNRYSSL